MDKQFGANALVFAVLDFTEKGTFDPESLALVQRMTDALEAIDELFNVSSLTNIVDIRKTEYGVEVGDLIPEIPETREELDRLEEYVLSKEMYVNTLISPDAKYTVLVANIEGGADEGAAAHKVLETIKEVAGDHPYYFGGDPAILVYMDLYMAEDLAVLVPLMLVVMVVILAVSFRRFLGVLPAPELRAPLYRVDLRVAGALRDVPERTDAGGRGHADRHGSRLCGSHLQPLPETRRYRSLHRGDHPPGRLERCDHDCRASHLCHDQDRVPAVLRAGTGLWPGFGLPAFDRAAPCLHPSVPGEAGAGRCGVGTGRELAPPFAHPDWENGSRSTYGSSWSPPASPLSS